MAANGDNICKNKAVTASSTSTNENLATDGLLFDGHDCITNGACASIRATDNDFWMTIDLGDVYSLRTIIYLTDVS